MRKLETDQPETYIVVWRRQTGERTCSFHAATTKKTQKLLLMQAHTSPTSSEHMHNFTISSLLQYLHDLSKATSVMLLYLVNVKLQLVFIKFYTVSLKTIPPNRQR